MVSAKTRERQPENNDQQDPMHAGENELKFQRPCRKNYISGYI